MATKAEKKAFLKLWYSPSVETIEDFRKEDPNFSGEGVIEGKPDTYPKGYTNQSLNQKAQRYVNSDDRNERSYNHKDWVEPFEGAVLRDAKGKMIRDTDKKNKYYKCRKLKSGSGGGGGSKTQWLADDFAGMEVADWQNK